MGRRKIDDVGSGETKKGREEASESEDDKDELRITKAGTSSSMKGCVK